MQIFDILNFLNFFLPLFWLAGILIYWLKHRQIKIWWVKYGILVIFALYIVWGAYATVANYNLWKAHPVSRYLLPPYQATYIYEYSFFHFWLPNSVNIAMSLIWAATLFILYKYSRGRFLGKEEIYLGLFTALLVGWPKFIIYLMLFFGMLLLCQLAGNFIFKNKSPVQVTHSLVVSAVIIAILGKFFVSYFGLDVLMF